MSFFALAAWLATWPPFLPPAPPVARAPAAPAPDPHPVRFFFAPEDLERVLPRDAIKRVGLIADLHAFEGAVAAAAFTAAARERGLEVVPLPVSAETSERSARQLSSTYRVDAVAVLRLGGLAGEGAVADIWSRNGARLESLATRLPPTPEERAQARAEAEYASRRLTVSGAQQFVGDGKRQLSREEFYGLVGRKDLAEQEQGTAVARGLLVGAGITAGSVGLVLELVQLVFYAVAAPIDIAGCELGHALTTHSSPYGSPEPEPCTGPDLSPVPLFIALGGGVMALTGAAINGDAASPSEREDLARAYNLRLHEKLGQPSPARAPVTVGVSAAALPEGGMLLLRGRF